MHTQSKYSREESIRGREERPRWKIICFCVVQSTARVTLVTVTELTDSRTVSPTDTQQWEQVEREALIHMENAAWNASCAKGMQNNERPVLWSSLCALCSSQVHRELFKCSTFRSLGLTNASVTEVTIHTQFIAGEDCSCEARNPAHQLIHTMQSDLVCFASSFLPLSLSLTRATLNHCSSVSHESVCTCAHSNTHSPRDSKLARKRKSVICERWNGVNGIQVNLQVQCFNWCDWAWRLA